MYRNRISHQACKTVLLMGGSQVNCWRGKFIVETNIGTFGGNGTWMISLTWEKLILIVLDEFTNEF
ncbi:hypothetical protein [Calothrix sp. NIES-3974]|uniref:hypothetical protein n=1 Tax=Calothrix sp. NIES-3974 TaxID=2005462 RepID=UPI000B604672|nr:hypothetical protein [Calothrix sp. NIES-3974]BAZ05635.1 hypothetical protein NIES3974_22870 [Calothrix sp. NIES-3974]